MTKERTISYHEHYVQVGFYQTFIKNKEKEIDDLKKELDFSNQENKVFKSKNEVLKAKLEVSQKNRITL